MLLWFVGGSLVIVWFVFRSAVLDYRLLALGAVLPCCEALLGRSLVLHTLLAPIALMAVIMAATSRRRLVRRRWLCIPIGLFLHLVLDGVWMRAELFWWPVLGTGFGTEASLEASRGLGVNLALEAAGVAALVWGWTRFGLAEPRRRRLLVRTGHLDRALVAEAEARR